MNDKEREDIHKIIDELGFKSLNKFKKGFFTKYPNITNKQLQ